MQTSPFIFSEKMNSQCNLKERISENTKRNQSATAGTKKWQSIFHSWFCLRNIITKVRMKSLLNYFRILLTSLSSQEGERDNVSEVANPTGPGCRVWLLVPAHLSSWFFLVCFVFFFFLSKASIAFYRWALGNKSILGYWCSRHRWLWVFFFFFFGHALFKKDSVSAASAKVALV